MTQQITLPREVVEQLVAALEYHTAQTRPIPRTSDAIDAGRAALANVEPMQCTWSKDPDFEMGDTYHSACGEAWSFIDGGPAENRVRYCHGCGKQVAVAQEVLE